jgi:hypothetical protein
MNLPAAFFFFIISGVLMIVLRMGWITNRPIYHAVVGLGLSTGVGFLIPVIVYYDIAIAFVVLMSVDMIYHWRRRRRR